MELRPLTDDEIRALVNAEYNAAEQYSDEIAEDRAEAIDYYYGRPLGDEVEGRSRVVSSDVSDVIEWMMPGLLRVVAGDDELVQFTWFDEDQAKVATKLVNHVIDEQNEGYLIKHDTLKDGLLSKMGAAKVLYTVKKEPVDRDYTGLGEMELTMLMEGLKRPGYEVSITGQESIPQPDGTMLYNVRVRIMRVFGQVEIQAIPPEELRVPRNARVIDDSCRYVAHDVETMTRSDLVAMGVHYDVVMDLPASTDNDDQMRQARNGFNADQAPIENKMAEYVEYTEHYVLADVDGDGITERRMICTSGDKILRNEVIPYLPVAAWSPFRMAHAAIGLSLADRCMDIQRVRTALMRGMLDNIYAINAGGRYAVTTGKVNMDDLLTMRLGGAVRVKEPGNIQQLPVEFVGDKAVAIDERMKNVREERTGVNRHNQGLNGDSLHQTLGGMQTILEQGLELQEYILRNYVEFFYKRLSRLVLDHLVRYQDEAMQLMVSGKKMDVNPADFIGRMGIKTKVGVGAMRKQERIAMLKETISSQVEALSMGLPIVTIEQVYNATADLAELTGSRPERYWVDPAKMPPKPQEPAQPDPLVQAEMIKQQRAKEEGEAKLKLEEAQSISDLTLEREKMDREDQRFYTEMELKYLTNVPGSRV